MSASAAVKLAASSLAIATLPVSKLAHPEMALPSPKVLVLFSNEHELNSWLNDKQVLRRIERISSLNN